jgi:hypothetical protein
MDSLSSHPMRWALPKKTSRQGRLFSTYDKNKDSQISEARLWSCIKNLDLETLPVELVKQCKMSASLTSSTGHWQFLALCHVSNEWSQRSLSTVSVKTHTNRAVHNPVTIFGPKLIQNLSYPSNWNFAQTLVTSHSSSRPKGQKTETLFTKYTHKLINLTVNLNHQSTQR